MADELSMALLDLLRKAEAMERTDFVRQAVERLAQAIVEVEVEQKVGAARYERTETRNNRIALAGVGRAGQPSAASVVRHTYNCPRSFGQHCAFAATQTRHPSRANSAA